MRRRRRLAGVGRAGGDLADRVGDRRPRARRGPGSTASPTVSVRQRAAGVRDDPAGVVDQDDLDVRGAHVDADGVHGGTLDPPRHRPRCRHAEPRTTPGPRLSRLADRSAAIASTPAVRRAHLASRAHGTVTRAGSTGCSLRAAPALGDPGCSVVVESPGSERRRFRGPSRGCVPARDTRTSGRVRPITIVPPERQHLASLGQHNRGSCFARDPMVTATPVPAPAEWMKEPPWLAWAGGHSRHPTGSGRATGVRSQRRPMLPNNWKEVSMENPKPEKVAVVEEVREKLSASDAALFTEYRGLTVRDLAELRTAMRDAGGEYRVYKNTLVRRAAAELDLELDAELVGPTAIAFVGQKPDGTPGDPVMVAKALQHVREVASPPGHQGRSVGHHGARRGQCEGTGHRRAPRGAARPLRGWPGGADAQPGCPPAGRARQVRLRAAGADRGRRCRRRDQRRGPRSGHVRRRGSHRHPRSGRGPCGRDPCGRRCWTAPPPRRPTRPPPMLPIPQRPTTQPQTQTRQPTLPPRSDHHGNH